MNITTKIVLIGDKETEKTALREKFIGKGFSKNYMMTIGADYVLRQVRVLVGGKDHIINVQVWDLASQDQYKKTRIYYYKNLKGIIAVIDVTRYESYTTVLNLLNEIKTVIPDTSKIPVLLIGNKIDERSIDDPNHISRELGEQFVEKISESFNEGKRKVTYLETSVKSVKSLQKEFIDLVSTIVKVIAK